MEDQKAARFGKTACIFIFANP